jgi:hypothetical protein
MGKVHQQRCFHTLTGYDALRDLPRSEKYVKKQTNKQLSHHTRASPQNKNKNTQNFIACKYMADPAIFWAELRNQSIACKFM